MSRIAIVQAAMESTRSDGFLVTNLKNVRYLTGFTGSNGYCLITGRSKYFFTDSRYTEQSRLEVKGFKIVITSALLEDIYKTIKKHNVVTLAFESTSLVHSQFVIFKKFFKGVKLKPVRGFVEASRILKDSGEIALIKKAVKVANKGFEKIRRSLSKGLTERELSLLAEREVRALGADSHSFPTIIASGARAALPHASPTNKKVKKGELVIVDMGVTLGGYNSDETRTFMVGSPTKKQKEVYDAVKEAHDRAIDEIKPGVSASHIDKTAREVIDKAGYGKYFIHSTGHGVGIDIHEEPGVSAKSTTVLEEGMVITVEPGIYIPGWGGVRLEDMVHVVKGGAKRLTDGSKDFKPVT